MRNYILLIIILILILILLPLPLLLLLLPPALPLLCSLIVVDITFYFVETYETINIIYIIPLIQFTKSMRL